MSMKLSLTSGLRLVVGSFFFIAAASAVSVYLMLGSMAQDGRVVNFAGIVRGGDGHLGVGVKQRKFNLVGIDRADVGF